MPAAGLSATPSGGRRHAREETSPGPRRVDTSVSTIRRRRIGLRSIRSRPVTPDGGWSGLVDLHSHVLPGVDDGADSFEESVEIVRAAPRDGISVIAATPHVRDDYPTRSETMLLLVEDIQDRLRTEGVNVDLLPGGEVAFDMIAELDSRELRAVCPA